MGVDSWPTGGPIAHSASDLGRQGTGSRPGRASADYDAHSSTQGGSGARVPPTTSLPDPKAARPAAPARHRIERVTTPRRSGGPLGDRRGLTAAGAFVLLLVFGLAGGGLDHLFGHGLWMFFSIGFVAAVLVNAVRVHLEDLAASIVMVPISYAVVGFAISLPGTLGFGSGLKREITTAAGVLVYGAPILLLALLAAVLIAGGRARAATVARRRARSRAVRRFGDLPPGSRPRRQTSRATTKRSRR
jgi:hypothetical protein